MEELLDPQVEARLGEIETLSDTWEAAEGLAELIPPEELEREIANIESKYSAHMEGRNLVIYRDEELARGGKELTSHGSVEDVIERYANNAYEELGENFVKEQGEGRFSFSARRVAVVGTWARQHGYRPRGDGRSQRLWRLVDEMRGVEPNENLERAVESFNSKYSLRLGKNNRLSVCRFRSSEEKEKARVGDPRHAVGIYLNDARRAYGGIASAYRQRSRSVVRAAAFFTWAKRRNYQ